MIFYHPFALFFNDTPLIRIIHDLGFFLLTMKLKYAIHYGTRRAYQILHFSLDRISKIFNFRKGYQIIQSLFIPFAGHIT